MVECWSVGASADEAWGFVNAAHVFVCYEVSGCLVHSGTATVVAGSGYRGILACPFGGAGLSGFGVGLFEKFGIFSAAFDAAGCLAISSCFVVCEVVDRFYLSALRASLDRSHFWWNFGTVNSLATFTDSDSSIGSRLVNVEAFKGDDFLTFITCLVRSSFRVIAQKFGASSSALPFVMRLAQTLPHCRFSTPFDKAHMDNGVRWKFSCTASLNAGVMGGAKFFCDGWRLASFDRAGLTKADLPLNCLVVTIAIPTAIVRLGAAIY